MSRARQIPDIHQYSLSVFGKNDLATLLRKHPKLLKVLHEHGIHFCAGCFLTLSSAPERAAAYHGVPDIPRFMKAVRRAAPHVRLVRLRTRPVKGAIRLAHTYQKYER